MRLSIATENGSFINHTIQTDFEGATARIEASYQHIENLVQNAVEEIQRQEFDIVYQGMDTSVNPGNTPDSSIVTIMKTIRKCEGDEQYEFGEGGSLSSVRFLTKCVQSCNVKKVGYCGVMLPVLEDAELTRLWKQV